MNNILEFDEYLDYAYAYHRDHPEQREGQALFNALYHLRPALANGFRGGNFDPFHIDQRIQVFLDKVKEHWG